MTPVDIQEARKREYYNEHGRLNWGWPIDVGHLILQLQTLDPKMKVGSVYFVDIRWERKSRASGLSLSYERWGEDGWLDFSGIGPLCLAVWASEPKDAPGSSLDALEAAQRENRMLKAEADKNEGLMEMQDKAIKSLMLEVCIQRDQRFNNTELADARERIGELEGALKALNWNSECTCSHEITSHSELGCCAEIAKDTGCECEQFRLRSGE